MRPRVIVVGLGTMGAAAAWRLAARGADVVGLDRFAPPHRRGAHAGGTRIIRMAYMEGAAYVPLVRRAYPMWRDLEAATGRRLLTPSGALMLGPADLPAVAGSAEAAREHGLAHEVLDAAEVRRRFPAFTPGPDEVGVFEEAAGLLRPEAAIEAMLGLARDAGADLRTGAEVTGWWAGPEGVGVRTADGELRADRLVLAPGAWAGRLLDDLDLPLRVERRVQHYWRPADLSAYAPERFPVWIWDAPTAQRGTDRRCRRRGEGRHAQRRRARRPRPGRRPGDDGRGRHHAGVARVAGAGPRGRRVGGRGRVPVHAHPRHRLRPRAAPRARQRRGGLRLLGARLQVRARRRGCARRPDAGRGYGGARRAVRPGALPARCVRGGVDR
ncbi:N-methyl-L-tryptophan oxidase [Luedemannella flava]